MKDLKKIKYAVEKTKSHTIEVVTSKIIDDENLKIIGIADALYKAFKKSTGGSIILLDSSSD